MLSPLPKPLEWTQFVSFDIMSSMIMILGIWRLDENSYCFRRIWDRYLAATTYWDGVMAWSAQGIVIGLDSMEVSGRTKEKVSKWSASGLLHKCNGNRIASIYHVVHHNLMIC